MIQGAKVIAVTKSGKSKTQPTKPCQKMGDDEVVVPGKKFQISWDTVDGSEIR